MGLLFLVNIYPHYYAWWVFWNYINDAFYVQFTHQLFFSATEVKTTIIIPFRNSYIKIVPVFQLVSTLMILHLADRDVQ